MASKKTNYALQIRALSPLLLLALFSLVSYFLGPDLTRFDRSAIDHGEWWRLLSCHITHLGIKHLMINLAGLVLIGLLFNGLLRFYDWLLVVVITALGVGACLYSFELQLQRYVGLSGLLHGVMLYAALISWPKQRFINSALLLIIVAKLGKELIWGPGEVEHFIGGPVLIMAHVYGALVGLLLSVAQLSLQRLRNCR